MLGIYSQKRIENAFERVPQSARKLLLPYCIEKLAGQYYLLSKDDAEILKTRELPFAMQFSLAQQACNRKVEQEMRYEDWLRKLETDNGRLEAT